MIRVKSYNRCLIFVSKFFLLYVMSCLIFSFLLFLTCIFIWAHKYLCFRAKLVARTRVKLSSLFSILFSTSAKILTNLTLWLLLYLFLSDPNGKQQESTCRMHAGYDNLTTPAACLPAATSTSLNSRGLIWLCYNYSTLGIVTTLTTNYDVK